MTLVTDHNALTFIPTQPNMSRRQARWSEFLQRFDHEWRYIKGATNVADPLSRCPGPHADTGPVLVNVSLVTYPGPPSVFEISVPPTVSVRERLVAAYVTDPWFAVKSHTKPLRQDKQGLWRLHKKGRTGAILVPNDDSCKLAIMREMHDTAVAGHAGPARTLATIRRWFYWRGMVDYMTTYVSHCASCQRMKPATRATAGPLHPLPVPSAPWDSISMDLMTCLPETADGCDTIVVFVDRLTKYCVAVPTRLTVDAPGFAQIMIDHVIARFGAPTSIVSDRDTRFTSAFFKTLVAKLGISMCMSTSFHPHTDGQTERMNRLLQETLRHFVCFTQNDWDMQLQLACFAINNADSGSTGASPFFLN